MCSKRCKYWNRISTKIRNRIVWRRRFYYAKIRRRWNGFYACRYYVLEKILQAGEVLKIDTGCIVGFTAGVDYDIQFVGGIKNTIFGGEGLFFASLRMGKVWIQSLPVSRLAGRILAYGTYNRKEEGSILGELEIC
jgi:hypothetical protein